MPRGRKKKKVGSEPPRKPVFTSRDDGDAAHNFHDRQIAFNHREVERRIAAIQAIQEAEVHNMLARLRMLRSYLSKEQLQTPALKFFQENLPNLSVVRNEEDKVFELRENEKFFYRNGRASVVTAVGGSLFSMESVKQSFLNADGLQIPDFVLDGALDTQMSQMLGVGQAFQTPGGPSNRSSFTAPPTPRTSRLPKQGEMLLSVHGSPLGVYKEDHLEAIHESGDDSHADASG
ncbi:uncharacterized protein LOC110103319 [Dendrobium catenatum]|uniref:Uncharacterized protein n=1 Tax=Dendrobium catenatum TaxID=906689 RepID=A0A2I0X6R8_9ASPA|nr:uncharacterized protein LOC110103319 [Dendrobium catenatum]PKU83607.1 hypothetical protein MA16_Dca019834 [Dendrobium catenatum]